MGPSKIQLLAKLEIVLASHRRWAPGSLGHIVSALSPHWVEEDGPNLAHRE